MDIIDTMSKDLYLSKGTILRIINSTFNYKIYYTNKHGNPRKITHPSKELKVLQYWIVNNIFKYLPVSEYSSAYDKGCSIQKNALIHAQNNFILHTDINKFFESINKNHITNLLTLSNLGLSDSDIEFICKIVLYKEHLVVGSVASPRISNCLMYDFDLNLNKELLNLQECIFTRYADDIIISSKTFIPENTISIVDHNLVALGLTRNVNKTYFSSKSVKRQITGIVIDNNDNSLSVGSRYLNELKYNLYQYLLHEKGDLVKIRGQLSFVKSINEKQYENVIKKYSKYKNSEKFKSFYTKINFNSFS